MRKIFNLSILIMIFVFIKVDADLRLKIDPYRQWGRNTCWAAVCVQIFNAYGESQTDEKLIRCWATEDSKNCDTHIDGPTDVTKLIVGGYRGVEEILFDYSPYMRVYGCHLPYDAGTGHGAPDEWDLIEQIESNRPMVIGIRINRGAEGHIILGVGYTGGNGHVEDLFYNNSRTGRMSQIKYKSLTTNPDQIWYETLMLETYPRYPIPTPVDPHPPSWVDMDNEGSYEIAIGQDNLFYSAERSNHNPANWTFVLYIYHRDGKYTSQYETFYNTTASKMQWNVSNFSFSPDEQWIYDCEGKILAQVETIVVDATSNYRSSHIVSITPEGELYSGNAGFFNKEVNQALSDQISHQYMNVTKSNFLNNANVNFYTGGRIDISDLSISEGATVNFLVNSNFW